MWAIAIPGTPQAEMLSGATHRTWLKTCVLSVNRDGGRVLSCEGSGLLRALGPRADHFVIKASRLNLAFPY